MDVEKDRELDSLKGQLRCLERVVAGLIAALPDDERERIIAKIGIEDAFGKLQDLCTDRDELVDDFTRASRDTPRHMIKMAREAISFRETCKRARDQAAATAVPDDFSVDDEEH